MSFPLPTDIDISAALPVWQIVLLGIISLGVGLLGGFVGLALGTMRLPCLLLIGVDPTTAAGTNILVSSLSAFGGGYRHLLARRVHWRLVLWMGVPSVIGSFLGGFASSTSIPEGALVIVAGCFVTWQSVEFVARFRQGPSSGAAPEYSSSLEIAPKQGLIEGFVGLIVGLVGGAVGLILGSVRLPVIVRVLKIDPRLAGGSNLVIGFFMGLFGFIGHGVRGEVDLTLLATMGVAGMVGAYTGAHFTGRVSLNALIMTMSGVLFIVGILLVRDGITRWV